MSLTAGVPDWQGNGAIAFSLDERRVLMFAFCGDDTVCRLYTGQWFLGPGRRAENSVVRRLVARGLLRDLGYVPSEFLHLTEMARTSIVAATTVPPQGSDGTGPSRARLREAAAYYATRAKLSGAR